MEHRTLTALIIRAAALGDKSNEFFLRSIVRGLAATLLKACIHVIVHDTALASIAAGVCPAWNVIIPFLATLNEGPVFYRVGMAYRVNPIQEVCSGGAILPVFTLQIFLGVGGESAIAAPGIQCDGNGPSGTDCTDVDAVVLGAFSGVAYVATEAEVRKLSAAEFAVKVMLVVPAEPTLTDVAGCVYEAIVHPRRPEEGIVDTGDADSCFV